MPLLRIPACSYWTFPENPGDQIFKSRKNKLIMVKTWISGCLGNSYEKTDFDLVPYKGAIDPAWNEIGAKNG